MTDFDYQLQRRPVGVIWVDNARRVVAANALARRLLERVPGTLLGADLLALHPEPARAKVQWLLDAALAAAGEAVGMAMTVPGMTLVAKVTTMDGIHGPGWCLIFHLPEGAAKDSRPAPVDVLLKLPVGSRHGVTLLDVDSVVHLEAQGHYTRIHTGEGQHFCSLAFAELERRLDPTQFLRVHRSFIVNLAHAEGIARGDGHWAIIMAAAGRPRVPVSRARVALVRRRLAL